MSTFKFAQSVYFFICRQLVSLMNDYQRKTMLKAMAHLDDHLLDDIGYRREGDQLIPLDESKMSVSVRNHRRKVRLRHAFLVRRRRRACSDRR